ncbi:hypothetical protein IB254_09420 [Pseudomonas sp. PDM03]|uniref:hypothetical protein n=1 Tax=Pseudomonas sp. PDM03 TaxID=2769266 RepID=UPI0017869B9F|nr:hypothetical protein [Pseudomonas sp. PDM03]MBD9587278.1 hypothetical protein [Pseudomonas sp. PDM03]
MTNNELIEGRNLIEHGGFTSGWQATWTAEGAHLVREDSVTGKSYLQLNNGATARCSVDLPIHPHEKAIYWFSFSYEGLGVKPSNVTIRTAGGVVIFDESFISRKPQVNSGATDPAPLAELRPYPPIELEGLSLTDKKIELVVTAATGGTREGINVTDFKFDLRLVPLELSQLLLDGRQIPLAVFSTSAVS